MSILTKTFDFRADAIITDCFVVMPEGVKDKDGNRTQAQMLQILGED